MQSQKRSIVAVVAKVAKPLSTSELFGYSTIQIPTLE